MHRDATNTWQTELTEYLKQSSTPLLVVLGPTTSGKTDFSITLAQLLLKQSYCPVVVNADSRQCYRKLDIGTAKITEDEKQGIDHRLFDILDPKEELTVGLYRDLAEAEIQRVWSEGGIPILCGGSMMYIASITDQMELENAYIKRSKTEQQLHSTKDCFIIGIHRERKDLHERILKRTSMMLDEGWIDEVQALLDAGYTTEDPGMKSHGYREVMAYIHHELTRTELEERINIATRNYVKRQTTWWKTDPRIHWLTV